MQQRGEPIVEQRSPASWPVRAAVVGVISTVAAAVTGSASGAQSVGGDLRGSEPASGSSSGTFAIIVAIAVAVILIAIVVAIVAVTLRRSRRSPDQRPPVGQPAPAPAPAPHAAPPVAMVDTRSAAERARLVQVLIEVGDQLDSAALAAWVGQALAEVGVAEVVADGERFDPARHQALDSLPTGDPAADGTVAQTPRRGYVDRGQVVRLPQVLVYRFQAAP